MRKAVKILHTLAACGLVGGLAVYMIVLASAAPDAEAYAEARRIIYALSSYLLLPSLAVALISGLLSMVVHRPFQEQRWVWLKALLGLSLFEATLGIIQAKANAAATLAAKIAAGEAGPEAIATTIANEWASLCVILTLSVAQIVLGVWRPRLARRPSQAVASLKG